jgi:hypothetical protein
MAKLTREDEKELKRNSDIRRDFSVIHSGQMKKNHLFLGPARFVNVSGHFYLIDDVANLTNSMIARIIANFSVRENTSLSECSGLLISERK